MTNTLECNSLKFRTPQWSCDYSVKFEPGRWHVICGSSGSGKSTLLHLLTGMISPLSGHISIAGLNISNHPPHRRGISFMSQANSLFPGISVFENLLLALHDSRLSLSEKKQLVTDTISKLSISPTLLDRYPEKLSGGELSRCNLARSILRPCTWLLLDEPFAAVDRPTRLSILQWLKNWQKSTGSGILLVSHDLDDIYTVATDVTIIDQGKVLESSSILSAIEQPNSIVTARLLRSGLIFHTSDGPAFVNAANLYTRKQSLTCDSSNARSVVLRDAQVTKTGKITRIIDLVNGSDFILASEDQFDGSVWFDSKDIKNLFCS